MKEPVCNPFSLKDKLILITGASSGIGRQCAISCSNMGASVVLFGRDAGRLQETLTMMQNIDYHLLYDLDLVEYDKVEKIVKDIAAMKGKISGLINCAGISTTLPFSRISPDKIEYFFRTNVLSAIILTKQVIKPLHFSDSGGSILFISSVMGSVGAVGKTLYAMTKGSIDAIVRSLALEYAPKKIRVNSVSPGVVETPMSKNSIYALDEESLHKIKRQHPLGLGLPEDVANACVFLLSDASRWITGTNLVTDGGYLAG